ncbi:MAG TPA: lyase family protein [Thermomicrobiales bacterium]|nr:lyase family protein [Thermomicrobiales bacterium]
MADDARAHVRSFLPTSRPADQIAPSGSESRRPSEWRGTDSWRALWTVAAVHGMELRRSEVIDDAGFAAVARALDVVRRPLFDRPGGIRKDVAALEERIDAMMPRTMTGAATLGLSREEWLATTSRLLWRDTAINAVGALADISGAVLALAEVHAVTVMPALLGNRPAQPTTLAHFLGGLIGPLRVNGERLTEAFARLNRSPLGSGILAGDVLAADRGDLADRLAFDGIIVNTFDALASVEDYTELLDGVASAASILRRFVREIGLWVRTDQTSFVIDEEWTMLPEPGHPTLVLGERLDRLEACLGQVMVEADALTARLRQVGYGPLGSSYGWMFEAQERLDGLLEATLLETREFVRNGLIVNRAYLGNRAGRGYTTAGDLATFLMTEEQIAPASARNIAVLVLSRVKEANLEVGGITQDMIDSAAMMIIGQEIKVEMEALGRFLAPRRFIERRQVTGSAAPAMTREWLALEGEALERQRQWVTSRRARIDERLEAASGTIAEAAGEAAE